jgi:hypothetical protein
MPNACSSGLPGAKQGAIFAPSGDIYTIKIKNLRQSPASLHDAARSRHFVETNSALFLM